MSRKSRRRRQRDGQRNPSSVEAQDGFDFLDDREPGPVPQSSSVADVDRASSASGKPRVTTVAARGGPAVPAPDVERPSRSIASSPADVVTENDAVSTATALLESPPESLAVARPAPEPVPPVGASLIAARVARGLTVDQASARTRISAKMLLHLENDRWSEFAADAYTRGFLRSYGSFLGLDVNDLLGRFDALHGRVVKPEPIEELPLPVAESKRAPVVRRAPRISGRTKIVAAVVTAVGVLGAGAVYLTQQGMLELRPAAGLEQIEDELRQTQVPVAPSPASTPVTRLEPPVEPGAKPGNEDPRLHSGVAPSAVQPSATGPASTATVGNTPATRPMIVGPPAPSVVPGPRGKPEDTSPTPPTTPMPTPTSATSATSEPVSKVVVSEPVEDLLDETVESPPASPVDTEPLVLTATALDSCALRLQVDTDARHAQRYSFTQRGESRSWTAKQGFRLVVSGSNHLELRLNGRLVAVPADGRTVVFDRDSVGPGRASTTAAGHPARSSRRPRR